MWTAKLAYIADIFSRLNDLNCSLQRNHTNIFTLRNKTDAFKMKTGIFEKQRAERQYRYVSMFARCRSKCFC